ncbi:hypothetical protein GF319_10745 [Candidatus Bathyarchaeota archaeon]|jgi:DNA-directed RNA polymerase subunit M|nr:hypothetical protein [Candidatus Bathyarchaeota archaeon]
MNEGAIVLQIKGTRLSDIANRRYLMEFCENCGSMLMIDPDTDELSCPNCGVTQRTFETGTKIVKDHSSDESKIYIQGSAEDKPAVPASCPRCDNGEAYVWTQTIGFGNTEQVQCYRCTECGHTWR